MFTSLTAIAVATETIHVDAAAYQFKGGGNAEGVTDRLLAVTTWDPIAAAVSPIILHQHADGRVFVVDGHQRTALAKRLGVAHVSALVLDGLTIADARRLGAKLNLQQGTGTAIDVAKLVRDRAITDAERATLPADGISGETIRTGEALAQLAPAAFLLVVNERVSYGWRNTRYAAIVGRLVTGEAEQVAALTQLARVQPDTEHHAEAFIRTLLAAGFERGVQTDLFGDMVVATSLAEPIAEILAGARKALTTEKIALGGALKHGKRLTARGNRLNQRANRQGVADASAQAQQLAVLGYTVGPVRDEIKRVAALVTTKTITMPHAVDAVLAALAEARAITGDNDGPRMGLCAPGGAAEQSGRLR